MKHIFIINPAAGKGKSLELIPYIKECFKDCEEDYIVRITEYPGHATELAKEYSGKGKCRIYSIGGDGTVNEIVNGMAGTDSALGIIPSGSGNDFFRSIHAGNDIKRILLDTVIGEERQVDLAKANDKYFINVASVGFDAEIVFNAQKFKKLPGISGSMAYVLSLLYTTVINKNNNIEIDIDGIRQKMSVLLAAIANGRYYGGGMMPAPDAKLNDGWLDICLIRVTPRWKIFALFPKFIKGLHGQLKEVSFYRGKSVTIQSEKYISLSTDGEVVTAKTIKFEILERAINVIFPGGGNTAAMLELCEGKNIFR